MFTRSNSLATDAIALILTVPGQGTDRGKTASRGPASSCIPAVERHELTLGLFVQGLDYSSEPIVRHRRQQCFPRLVVLYDLTKDRFSATVIVDPEAGITGTRIIGLIYRMDALEEVELAQRGDDVVLVLTEHLVEPLSPSDEVALETCRTAGEDSLPRPTPYVRHPSPNSRYTPQVRPRASGTRHHLDHLGHLFSCAARNGRSDRGSHRERPKINRLQYGCSK
jgi:hypothetical protein